MLSGASSVIPVAAKKQKNNFRLLQHSHTHMQQTYRLIGTAQPRAVPLQGVDVRGSSSPFCRYAASFCPFYAIF